MAASSEKLPPLRTCFDGSFLTQSGGLPPSIGALQKGSFVLESDS
jgi:hypothetical protein